MGTSPGIIYLNVTEFTFIATSFVGILSNHTGMKARILNAFTESYKFVLVTQLLMRFFIQSLQTQLL